MDPNTTNNPTTTGTSAGGSEDYVDKGKLKNR